METWGEINGNCWVVYFDILGFKNKIFDFEKGNGPCHLDVFVKNFYEKLKNEQKIQSSYHPGKIFITWFSDSFIFFTSNDSADSFGCVAGAIKGFCRALIKKSWTFTAAIGFGQLYAHKGQNVLLGSGLIDAYQYAEKQNWIGIVVTPKANKKLRQMGVALQSWPVLFKEYDVPVVQKQRVRNGVPTFVKSTERLFAVRIQKLPNVIRNIKRMSENSEHKDQKGYKKRYGVKYENTLKFFRE